MPSKNPLDPGWLTDTKLCIIATVILVVMFAMRSCT
jgi:hypothetical protein